MGSAASPSPITQTTYISDIPQWKKQLLGLTKDAPEYSPYKWLSRQATAKAKMLEGMTFNPNMKSMAQYYGVPEGTDLTPYIYASRMGQVAPSTPMPTNTQGTTSAIPMAKGGLMSLRKGYAKGGKPKAGFDASGGLTPEGYAFLQDKIASGGKPSKMYTDAMKKYEKANTASNAATGPAVPFSQANELLTPYYNPADMIPDPTDPTHQRMIPNPAKAYGGVTDPMFQQGVDYLRGISALPSQIGQATDLYGQAASGLAGLANYSPQQVAAQNAAAQQAQASLANRGDIRDVTAHKADVSQYNASLMQAPKDVQARDYEAAQATAAQMQRPEDVRSKALQYFQMQGPGSWTDEGVSQKYMSPYMQGVIDIAKREKGKDYAKQLRAISGQAVSAGAFGGGRQAMERSQAAKDYEQQLQDLEVQGLQQAYQQGMGQYGAESSLGQQANIQNLQALLSTQSQESQQALQAALANQAAGLTTSQANLQAQQQTSLANQQAINQQRQQYVNNALQAAMQGYQGKLTAAQQNQIAQNAASQFNSQALNNANLTYEQQRIAAQQMNQGADLQTALQNAQLATGVSQSNASLGTQASLANAANALQAGIANQQAGLQANQQGISAYGAMGNMAQGLGNLGLGAWQGQQNIAGMYGAAANTAINAGKDWATNRYITGGNLWKQDPYAAPTGIVNQQPSTTGSGTQTGIPR